MSKKWIELFRTTGI